MACPYSNEAPKNPGYTANPLAFWIILVVNQMMQDFAHQQHHGRSTVLATEISRVFFDRKSMKNGGFWWTHLMDKIQGTSFSRDGYIAQVVSGYSRNRRVLTHEEWKWASYSGMINQHRHCARYEIAMILDGTLWCTPYPRCQWSRKLSRISCWGSILIFTPFNFNATGGGYNVYRYCIDTAKRLFLSSRQ